MYVPHCSLITFKLTADSLGKNRRVPLRLSLVGLLYFCDFNHVWCSINKVCLLCTRPRHVFSDPSSELSRTFLFGMIVSVMSAFPMILFVGLDMDLLFDVARGRLVPLLIVIHSHFQTENSLSSEINSYRISRPLWRMVGCHPYPS